jgi:NAD(P)H-flavin reductase
LANKITLLYSNRTEDDIIYKEWPESIKSSKIRIVNTLTHEKPRSWKGEQGHKGKEMMQKYLPDKTNQLFIIFRAATDDECNRESTK